MVDWSRLVRRRLAAARIDRVDHHAHLRIRHWLGTPTLIAVLPREDSSPSAPERASRGEGGAAHGGSTATVRGSGAPAERGRDSQTSRTLGHEAAPLPPPPPPPRDSDRQSRGEGGAARGKSNYDVRGSGKSPERGRDSRSSRHYGDADGSTRRSSDQPRRETGAYQRRPTDDYQEPGLSSRGSRDSRSLAEAQPRALGGAAYKERTET